MTVRPPLIDVASLAAALERPPAARPTLLDVRWDLAQGPRPDLFAAGHIPGAAFVDLDAALAAPAGDRSRGRHPLPDPAGFAAAMRAAGVDRGRSVVVYDDAAGTTAARAWWLLLHHGHPDVTVLDGGLAAWRDAGHPLAAGDPADAADAADPPGDFTADPGHMPTLDAAGAAALAADPDGLLLDARAGERYRGEVEPVDPAAGHIPGARSRPTTDNLDPDGRLRGAAELAADFAALGAAPSTGAAPTVGVYCGSGVTAAHEILALARAGIPAALYPGSFSEWSSDPSRPVATGSEP